jgi:hypothetical protein
MNHRTVRRKPIIAMAPKIIVAWSAAKIHAACGANFA